MEKGRKVFIDESNWKYVIFKQDIHVTNEDFYIATEWQIIKAVREAEKSLKDVAIQAATDVGVEIDRSRVVEGYYGMELGWREEGLADLREYFFAVKALQEGTPAGNIRSEALQRLDDFYHHPAFGLGPERPTPYHSEPREGWSFKETKPRFLSGVVDGVYLAMREKGWNAVNHNTQAIVQRAVELQQEGKMGVNLVALAALVDDKEHRYDDQIDPVCLTYALFSTVLSRAEPAAGAGDIQSTYHWKVDPEVEALGAAVVNSYNQALAVASQGTATEIFPFHRKDAKECRYAAGESDFWIKRTRIVKVDSDDLEGKLHWAVRWDRPRQRYTAVMFISPEIVDPVEYKRNPGIIKRYNPRPAVML